MFAFAREGGLAAGRLFDFSGLSDARFWEDLIGQILQPGACQYATK